MKLNLWPVKGINVYDLPEGIRAMFPYYSANEEDCIPQHEQARPDSHRELKADEIIYEISILVCLVSLQLSM